MHTLCLLTLTLTLLFPVELAQSTPPPDLQIIHFGWSKYQPGSLGLETGMAKAGDRNSPPPTRDDAKLEVLRSHAADNKQVIAEMEDRQRQRQIQEQSKIHTSASPAPDSRYQYSLEVKNTSAKQIAELQWDYVFSDPRTKREAFRYHFASKTKIKSGKSAKLTVYSAATPYPVVNADSSRSQENEKVIIKRMIYTDGSVWEAR